MAQTTDFEAIDQQIDDLQERRDGCRQAMALSRIAVIVSIVALALVLTVAETWRTPAVVFSAVAMAIGGTVWLGASRTSRDETAEQLAALDRTKALMIDDVAARNGWANCSSSVH